MRRPDRKELLAYLNGETASCPAIDKSAPLELPTQVSFIWTMEISVYNNVHFLKVKRSADFTDYESTAKKPRFEDPDVQKFKEQLAARLNTPKESSVTFDNIK